MEQRVVVYKKTIGNFVVDGGVALTASGELAPGRFNIRGPNGFVQLRPVGLLFVSGGAVIVFPGDNYLEVSGRQKTPQEAQAAGSEGLVTSSVVIEEFKFFGATYTRVEDAPA